jgi:hypothetical protein
MKISSGSILMVGKFGTKLMASPPRTNSTG